MNVAILSPEYPSPDSAAFAFVHARARLYSVWDREPGQEPIVVAVFVPSRLASEYTLDDVPVAKFPPEQLRKRLDAFAPDVLAIHFATYGLISFVERLPYPRVVWVHGHDIQWTLTLNRSRNPLDWVKKRLVLFPRQLYQILRIRRFLAHSKACVFVSRWLLETGQRHSARRYPHAIVIPNPVDTDLFAYREPTEMRDGILVKSLENRHPGHDVAIRAFARLPDACLRIVGHGRLLGQLGRLARRLEARVVLEPRHVPHEELPDLFHRHGFYVAPSRSETQGLSMCEAMSCGLPVVGSRVGGIPEFVRDGVDGYLVPPGKPEELRRAVETLVSDPVRFREMSLNAREQMERTCAASIVVKKELDALRGAIETRRGPQDTGSVGGRAV